MSYALMRYLVLSVTFATGCFGPAFCCQSNYGAEARHSFESDCADPLCGFRLINGSATPVTAFHPAEHALLLAAGTTIEEDGQYSVYAEGPEFVQLVVRCDPGTQLRAFERLASDPSSQIIETLPTSNQYTRQSVLLRGNNGVVDPPSPDTCTGPARNGGSVIVAAWGLTNNGPGVCTVDDVEFGLAWPLLNSTDASAE